MELDKVNVLGRLIYTNHAIFYGQDRKMKVIESPEGNFILAVGLGVVNPQTDKPVTKTVLDDTMASIGWVRLDDVKECLGIENVKILVSYIEEKIKSQAEIQGLKLLKDETP